MSCFTTHIIYELKYQNFLIDQILLILLAKCHSKYSVNIYFLRINHLKKVKTLNIYTLIAQNKLTSYEYKPLITILISQVRKFQHTQMNYSFISTINYTKSISSIFS